MRFLASRMISFLLVDLHNFFSRFAEDAGRLCELIACQFVSELRTAIPI